MRINGNTTLLNELISNLLDNAIRYTPDHGRITLRVLPASDANTVDGKPCAVLEVEDTGSGIAAAERERVFAPFYRAPSAQNINPSGAGLGLAIVRDIAALHQAEISLHDTLSGTGLKVRILFPAR